MGCRALLVCMQDGKVRASEFVRVVKDVQSSVSVCRDSQLVMTGQANYAGIRRGLVLGGRGIPDPPRGFRRLVVSCFRIPSATVRTRRLREFFGIEFAVVLFVRTDGQCPSVRTACVRQYGLFVVVSTD